MTKYYNYFIELAQYCMVGNVDALALTSKFMSRLRKVVANKITEHQFNTLIDYYAST